MAKTRVPQIMVLCAAACIAAGAFTVTPGLNDAVLYNHSPSMPIGLYVRADADVDPATIGPGAIVTVRAVDVAPDLAALRNFDDATDRFIKRVVAGRGQVVCAFGPHITIDGMHVATRVEQVASQNRLPHWSGCIAMGSAYVFLLGDGHNSFDGRYWGPTLRWKIEGAWRFLL